MQNQYIQKYCNTRIFHKKVSFAKCYVLIQIIQNIYFANLAFSITLEESVNLAVQDSIEIKVEKQKEDLAKTAKFDALTIFLPNIKAEYKRGIRNINTPTIPSGNSIEDVKTISLIQPIFNGFHGVSKMNEATHKIDVAQAHLNIKANNIALECINSYLNILNLRQIITLQSESIEFYKEILKLAEQKLSFSDISYPEFIEYEVNSRKVLLSQNENSVQLKANELKFTNLTGKQPDNLSEIKNTNYIADILQLSSTLNSKNPNIKMVNANFKAAKSAADAEKGKLLPKISLIFQYEDQKSPHYYNGQNVINKAIYINFLIPIFQSGSEVSGILKANIQKQIANSERALIRQQIETALKEEYQKYTSLNQTLELLNKTYANVQNSLKLALDRFKKRDIGKLDLLMKKVDLNDVQIQAINTKYQFYLSYYRIKALTNELFETNNHLR